MVRKNTRLAAGLVAAVSIAAGIAAVALRDERDPYAENQFLSQPGKLEELTVSLKKDTAKTITDLDLRLGRPLVDYLEARIIKRDYANIAVIIDKVRTGTEQNADVCAFFAEKELGNNGYEFFPNQRNRGYFMGALASAIMRVAPSRRERAGIARAIVESFLAVGTMGSPLAEGTGPIRCGLTKAKVEEISREISDHPRRWKGSLWKLAYSRNLETGDYVTLASDNSFHVFAGTLLGSRRDYERGGDIWNRLKDYVQSRNQPLTEPEGLTAAFKNDAAQTMASIFKKDPTFASLVLYLQSKIQKNEYADVVMIMDKLLMGEKLDVDTCIFRSREDKDVNGDTYYPNQANIAFFGVSLVTAINETSYTEKGRTAIAREFLESVLSAGAIGSLSEEKSQSVRCGATKKVVQDLLKDLMDREPDWAHTLFDLLRPLNRHSLHYERGAGQADFGGALGFLFGIYE